MRVRILLLITHTTVVILGVFHRGRTFFLFALKLFDTFRDGIKLILTRVVGTSGYVSPKLSYLHGSSSEYFSGKSDDPSREISTWWLFGEEKRIWISAIVHTGKCSTVMMATHLFKLIAELLQWPAIDPLSRTPGRSRRSRRRETVLSRVAPLFSGAFLQHLKAPESCMGAIMR